MVLVVMLIVGILSQRRGTIAAILFGLAALLASVSFGSPWPPVAASVPAVAATL
jgi:hypothetical protein